MKRGLRIITILALAALALGGGWAWLDLRGESRRAALPQDRPKLEGTYLCLAGDREMLFEIGTTTASAPIIKKTISYYLPRYWRVEPRGKGYAFLFNYAAYGYGPNWAARMQYPDPKTGKPAFGVDFIIVPSLTVPGDWDLTQYQDEHTREVRMITLPVPLTSFLHRLDEPRMSEYLWNRARFAAIKNAKEFDGGVCGCGCMTETSATQPGALVRQAGAIAAERPADPFAQLLHLWALKDAGDFEALRKRLEELRPQYARPGVMTRAYRQAEWDLHLHDLDAAGRNAHDTIDEITGTTTSLARRRASADELFRYEDYAYRVKANGGLPNWLNMQYAARFYNVLATFDLLQGGREEAQRLACANYRMGQLVGRDATLTGHLIGLSLRDIAGKELQLIALNGCETPDEMKAFWRSLEMVNRCEPQPLSAREWLWFDRIASALSEEQWPKIEPIQENIRDAITRERVTAARFQLVRMAAAARAHQLATGRLPGGAGDLSPLLPGGAPADAFTSAPLRLAPAGAGVVCYSVGPDKADDGGAIVYDPSNGTISRGDIVATVPAKREFPVPRGGLRAASLPELWRQMPEGLPPDPFALVSPHGQLRVAQTMPLIIYSCGPDRDDTMPQIVRPQAQYDPTNGATSRGDMWIQIPVR